MNESELDSFWSLLDEGEPERALERLGALSSEVREEHAGEVALLSALAHLDLGMEPEAGLLLQRAEAQLGSRPEWESPLRSARAEWHLARWEGAEAALLLARQGDDPASLERLALAEFVAGRPDAAEAALARADALDPEGAPPRLDPDAFDAVVRAAIAALPPEFQGLLESVPVVVDPAPTADLLGGVRAARASGIGPDLLGLFAGPSRLEASSFEGGAGLDEPARVYLFQRNLESAAGDAEELEREIGTTLFHELGHALGFDEHGVDELGLA